MSAQKDRTVFSVVQIKWLIRHESENIISRKKECECVENLFCGSVLLRRRKQIVSAFAEILPRLIGIFKWYQFIVRMDQ